MEARTPSRFDRRWLLVSSGAVLTVAALIKVGAGVAAQESTPAPGGDMTRQEMRENLQQYGFLWSATSPATKEGDTFALVVGNNGATPLKMWVRSMIMDHAAHHNEAAISEEIELAAGSQQSFQAVNAYGTANHFSTKVFTTTGDVALLGLQATLTDASGIETAMFNQRAFMVKTRAELEAQAVERQALRRNDRDKEGEHQHGDAPVDDGVNASDDAA